MMITRRRPNPPDGYGPHELLCCQVGSEPTTARIRMTIRIRPSIFNSSSLSATGRPCYSSAVTVGEHHEASADLRFRMVRDGLRHWVGHVLDCAGLGAGH